MGIPHISLLIFQMLSVQKKDRKCVEKIQQKRLRKLLRHTVSRSRFYRDLYKGIDIDHCSLQDLPVVTKPMMMSNFDDFVTVPDLKRTQLRTWLEDKSHLGQMYLGKYIPFQTSGTTGENALVVYDRHAMDFVHAAVMARHVEKKEPSVFQTISRFFKNFFGRKLRMASILMTGGPYPAYTAALYAPKAHDLFVNHKLLSLLDPVDKMVAELNSHLPQQIVSYPSILEILAREQLAGRLHLVFDSDVASLATGSEPLSATTRKLAKKAWNMDIQDTYGSSECFIMARSCNRYDRMHIMSDLCILEVVDRNYNPVPDGQTGEKLLLTNLFNRVQPFIRYEVSDVTGISTKPCDCGWPFPTLMPVEGRTDDIFYIDRPGGGYEAVHPYLFLGPMVELDEVREYQLAQTGRNEFTFTYVPIDPALEIDDKIRRVLETGLTAANFCDRFALIINKTDTIPRDPKSGKYRQLVSLVGAPEDLDEADRVNH